jgi:hypothetical protein
MLLIADRAQVLINAVTGQEASMSGNPTNQDRQAFAFELTHSLDVV